MYFFKNRSNLRDCEIVLVAYNSETVVQELFLLNYNLNEQTCVCASVTYRKSYRMSIFW